MNWTSKQEQAFSLRNREILVSAAAGSGKTAVMVERILKLVADEEPYLDIDKLLIVTFTKKAAESMRIKIRKELENRLKENPGNEHLQRQMLLINHAHISTIDSFCSYIVRNYFYLAKDVSSNYRIGDESEIKLLEDDVLKDVLEHEYEKGTDDFLQFVDYFATGKNDLPLETVIKSLYKYSQSHEDPIKWLMACKETYEKFDNDITFIADTIKSIIDVSIRNCINIANRAVDIANSQGGPYMYHANLISDLEILESILYEDNLGTVLGILSTIKFSRLSAKKDEGVSDELKEYCKTLRNSIKDNVKELSDMFAYADFDIVSEDILRCVVPVKELIRITVTYSNQLLSKKKEKNILDHSDVAHIALEILNNEENGISPAKVQLSKLFEEIFIDEYQDSNRLQEEILYSIAKDINGRKRVFMVGDVKQSIYSFRMACPELFINKLDVFTEEDSAKQKVFLSHNFRSRKQVIDSVNFIFKKLMERSVSGIDYDNSQELKYAASYSPEEADEYKTEVLHFSKSDQDINTYEAEGYMIASRIREIVEGNNPIYITDKKTGEKRKANYSDIAIIVRNQKDVVAPLKDVLTDEFGIPVTAMTQEDFFGTFEINIAVNYLKILDNPYREYPFAAVLLSPIVGFSASELAKIRLVDKDTSVYKALYAALESEDISEEIKRKINIFFETYNNLRRKISYTSVHELLWDVYETTGLEAFVAAMPAGNNRVNNLKRLLRRAVAFEKTSYRSLFDFLRYIEKIIELDISFGDSDSIAESEESVKIMTMHKSKGLEFPIVFLAGLSKLFNFNDERSSVILHQELGIGFDSVDVVNRTKRKTLIKRLIAKQKHIDKYGEEIRILYVAMTRAEEKLIITCCHDEGAGILESESFDFYSILKARNFWDWLRELIDFDNGLFEEREFFYSDFIAMDAENKLRKDISSGASKEIVEQQIYDENLLKQLEYKYKSETDSHLKKISVTALKEAYMFANDEDDLADGIDLIEKEVEYPLLPKFIQKKEGITGAQRGQLYHSVLEHWNYNLESEESIIKGFIFSLYEKGIFTEEEYQVINPNKIAAFLDSDLGIRMMKAHKSDMLSREQAFSVILKSDDPEFEFMGADTLLQGIIDAYFEEEDGLVIVDYKTDYLPDRNLTILVDKYAMQLKCYKYALEKILDKKVKEVWIYSVYADKAIRIDS